MFSATVITGINMKCWCTMPIPASIASRADEKLIGLPVHEDLAAVGPVEPVEDVHQRRLACTVLAEECMHFATADVEGDAVVRDDAWELLADVPHLEDEIVAHRNRTLRPSERREGAPCAPPHAPSYFLTTAGGLSLPAMIFAL